MIERLQRSAAIFRLTWRHVRARNVGQDTMYHFSGLHRQIHGDHVLSMVIEIVNDDVYGLTFLDPTSIHTVVDVGANVGVFSIAARARFRNSQIVAFEPADCNHALLAQNVDGLRIQIRRQAIGGAHRLVRIKDRSCDPTAFCVVPVAFSAEPLNGEIVTQLTLDEIVDELHRPIDLLKLDCEGSEYGVFHSAAMQRVKYLRAELHLVEDGNPELGLQAITDSGFKITKWSPFPGGKGIVWAENLATVRR